MTWTISSSGDTFTLSGFLDTNVVSGGLSFTVFDLSGSGGGSFSLQK
jgi:hypothetical protein